MGGYFNSKFEDAYTYETKNPSLGNSKETANKLPATKPCRSPNAWDAKGMPVCGGGMTKAEDYDPEVLLGSPVLVLAHKCDRVRC